MKGNKGVSRWQTDLRKMNILPPPPIGLGRHQGGPRSGVGCESARFVVPLAWQEAHKVWAVRVVVRAIALGLVSLWAFSGLASPPPAGVAPVVVPSGGFAIDGDLLANTPGASVGDWIASTNFP